MKNLKKWGLQILATITLATLAFAQAQPPGGGLSLTTIIAQITATSGWTYVSGTDTSTSTGKVVVTNDHTLVSGGLFVLSSSPNVLRTGGQTDIINMGEASGIEISAAAGERIRMISTTLMADATVLTLNGTTDQSADCDNAATGNALGGRVCIQAGQGSMVLTNSSVTANSIVLLGMRSDDSTCLSAYATPGAGTVTIGCVGAATATANTVVSFLVAN